MKVTLSWLREFAPDIDGDPVELSETLSALGLTVEDMTLIGDIVDGVVLAKVLDLRPHPAADKIQLVDVDAGDGQARQVCCGAFNMAVGDLIPFATPGTVMPNGLKIQERKMRGEVSAGMCCSGGELGLSDDHEGILVLNDRVVPDAELGMDVAAAIGAEPDVLWDLEVNANRPDAMSVAGVARDLAAALGVDFSFGDYRVADSSAADEDVNELLNVEILDPTLCGRFVATVLRGVTVGTSPQWLADRLRLAGMRPLNSIVDISNYVMLELGQPNHTFDLATIPNGHLRVRRAVPGETLTTLDGLERDLIANDGVITNESDEIVSLAGVMGGATTEISEQTTDVLLEMAWWDPPTISRTVKRLNLVSEASSRFRRGADWGENIDRSMQRFIQLASELGITAVGGFVDVAGDTPDRTPLAVRSAKINGLLGTELSAAEMAGYLSSIGFGADVVVSDSGTEDLAVTIPTWRWDTETETDVAEEVARLHGYENIARTVPKGELPGGLTDYQVRRRLVRQVLVGCGCDETFPMPFLAPGDLLQAGLADNGVTLSNPLVAEQSVLRTSLLPGQLKAIAYNQSHRNADVRFFEIDHVYLPPPADQLLPDEREHLAVALAGEEAPQAVAVLDLLERELGLPNVVLRSASPPGLHATRSAEVIVAGKARGVVGEIDPVVLDNYGVAGPVAWLELDLGELLSGPRLSRKYSPVSKYPSSDIDLAFEVPDEVTAAAVESSLRKAGQALLTEIELFDVYRGEAMGAGTRSLAYRLRFQAHDRTLTDTEVADVRQACIDAVTSHDGVSLRG
ncbi:MAG: phenylalanine--tRNA ligase subunit beta [Acidimicrobiaceae bacterium]|nr:phenylalanine--tRNA ligase subunit beta [Acidimicrobiaceae bacterium]MXW76509.1 phenylalanine--tRNA ligase subunit beta [Acidimicrobiaceae bacterium]MYA73796.1 phenylalanine--tRNA ligase subunit beta [Acidimicrobiaceae bacterium]MYC43753.1 phenylalanine--tRNA ligase subunit beta [Acidimicrobiaceae bacterium]MYD06051.1 phenylalanine--tRNA ligase subunit beta [Acidimicrobiaceae bacterium]